MAGRKNNRLAGKLAFMKMAVAMSRLGQRLGRGGPFGAVVVKGGKVVASAYNKVTFTNDPTAHAEIAAIRKACKKLGAFQLAGCEIYTSCEPCPMCLGAIYWARPKAVYYANTREDAAKIGFDDKFIYDEIGLPPAKRRYKLVRLECGSALEPFVEWRRRTDKIEY